MKNFSIIIPNRNLTTLLQRLLESIPKREDIEIIVVDDNSDPIIVDFNKYPGIDDCRVKVIYTKEGKGAGYARNIGLKHAEGRWIIFADSDDCFISDNINRIMDLYVDSDYDLIYCNIECLDIETNKIVDNANQQYIKYIESESDCKIDACRYSLRPPWGKIIKRDLIVSNNICFDETPVANDIMFSVKTGHASQNTVIDTTKMYRWYVRKNSITYNKSVDAALIHFYKAVERNVYLKEQGINKYRGIILMSIPNLIRCGVKPIKAVQLALVNTPFKYLFLDICQTIFLLVKKLCYTY